MRVWAFDDHISGGVEENERWVTRVGIDEPDNEGDIVSNTLVGHGDGALSLKEINRAAIVVGEDGGFGFERGVGGDESDEVLADEPLGVFVVRESRRAALGEDRG